MPEYHYNNDPKDTYTTLLSVGTKTNPGLHATTQRSVWTDDGDDSKSDAPFQLAMDAMQMQGTRRLEFNDDGTYMHSSSNGILALVADGTGIANSISLDSASGITLDADNATYGITYSDGATAMLRITNATSDVVFKQLVNDKDIVFQQDDGNEVIRVGNDRKLYFYDEGGEHITSDGTDMTISSGNDIKLTATTDIHIPADVGLLFGHASAEKIESTGSAMTITSAALTVDCAGDITLNADGGDFIFSDASVSLLTITNSSSDVVIKPLTDDKDIIFQQYDGTEVARIENDTYLSIAVGLRADAQDGATIGTATHQFSDLYLADRAAILFGDDGDITMTHVADTGVTIAGSDTDGTNLRIDNSAVDGDSVIQFALSNSVQYSMGVEDGDSDKFVINYGTGALGAQPALEISSAGAVNIPGALTTGSISYSALTVSQTTEDTSTILTLDSAFQSDDEGDRSSKIVFIGEKSGSEEHTLAIIEGAHDAGGDNQKGYLEFFTNTTADDAAPTSALKLAFDKTATFTGNINMAATKKLYLDGGNNTYIHETSADTVDFYIGGADRFVLDTNSYISLSNNDLGSGNTIFGKSAGAAIESGGNFNAFYGDVSGDSISTGVGNCAFGYASLTTMNTGSYNLGLGMSAGSTLTSGDKNIFIGYESGYGSPSSLLTGDENIAIGYRAGYELEGAAHSNTFLGGLAGNTTEAGIENTCLGYNTECYDDTATNQIVIGNNITAIDADNAIFIGNDTRQIRCDYGSDQTWDAPSDERIKNITGDSPLGLDFINAIPVKTFTWKSLSEYPEEFNAYNPAQTEPSDTLEHHGLIAQTVKSALDEAGVTDFSGWDEDSDGMQTVGESAFVYPLIKAVQELSAKVEALESAN
jgi:hypothetical protein